MKVCKQNKTVLQRAVIGLLLLSMLLLAVSCNDSEEPSAGATTEGFDYVNCDFDEYSKTSSTYDGN